MDDTALIERLDGKDFHPLLKDVAQIEVRADVRPGDLTQAQHTSGVIDHLARMHLDNNLDTALAGECLGLLPERRNHFVQLPFE